MEAAAKPTAISRRPPAIRPARLFADFGVRVAAILMDVFIVLLLTGALHDHLQAPTGVAVDKRYLLAGNLFAYFTAFWICPICATPAQFLCGIRVVDDRIERLSLGTAAMRSAALVALLAAASMVLIVPLSYLSLVALVAYGLLFLAALTPYRRAGHDLLARSLVVNRIALKYPMYSQLLRELNEDCDPDSRDQLRPAILSILGNLLILAVPLVIMVNIAMIAQNRDMQYRTGYAIEQVRFLKVAVEDFYAQHSYLPGPGQQLGIPNTARYPAGGYYELEPDGVIRIRFEVIPELRDGSLLMRPVTGDNGTTWQCSIEGHIQRSFLPAACRKPNL